jgi:hypothetical protein
VAGRTQPFAWLRRLAEEAGADVIPHRRDGQFCPVAKAAEIVCERWTPLIVGHGSRGDVGTAPCLRSRLHWGQQSGVTSIDTCWMAESAGTVARDAAGRRDEIVDIDGLQRAA